MAAVPGSPQERAAAAAAVAVAVVAAVLLLPRSDVVSQEATPWWPFLKGLVFGATGLLGIQVLLIHQLYLYLFFEKRWIAPSLGSKPHWAAEFQLHQHDLKAASDAASQSTAPPKTPTPNTSTSIIGGAVVGPTPPPRPSPSTNQDTQDLPAAKRRAQAIITNSMEHREAWPVGIVEFLRLNLAPPPPTADNQPTPEFGPTEPCHWLNLIIKRYFIALRQSEFFKDKIKDKWNDRINRKIKGNAFINGCRVTDFAMGHNAPDVRGVRVLRRFKEDASITCDFDFEYKGGASIAIEAQLPGGIKLPVRVHVGSMIGRLRMRTPSIPFNDMIALAFPENPGVTFTVDSPITIASNEYIRGMVNKLISNAIRKIFLEMWVLPTWRTFFLPQMEPKMDDVIARANALREFNQSNGNISHGVDSVNQSDNVIGVEQFNKFNNSVGSFPNEVVNTHNVGVQPSRTPSPDKKKGSSVTANQGVSKRGLLKAVNIWEARGNPAYLMFMRPSKSFVQDCLLGKAFPTSYQININYSAKEVFEHDEMFIKEVLSLMEVHNSLNDLMHSNSDEHMSDDVNSARENGQDEAGTSGDLETDPTVPTSLETKTTTDQQGTTTVNARNQGSANSGKSVHPDWRLTKHKNGIKLYKRKLPNFTIEGSEEQLSDTSTQSSVHRAAFVIKCDAERVYGVLSNTEHFRHMESTYAGSDLVHKFNDAMEVRKMRYYENLLNPNTNSGSAQRDRMVTCLQIKRKLTLEEGVVDQNSYIVAIRSVKVGTKMDESTTADESEVSEENASAIFIFAYHITPLESDPMNASKVVAISQFGYNLRKLELTIDYCKRVKNFIEELASISSTVPAAALGSGRKSSASAVDFEDEGMPSLTRSDSTKKVSKLKSAISGLGTTWIKRKDRPVPNAPSAIPPSGRSSATLQTKMTAVISGHSDRSKTLQTTSKPATPLMSATEIMAALDGRPSSPKLLARSTSAHSSPKMDRAKAHSPAPSAPDALHSANEKSPSLLERGSPTSENALHLGDQQSSSPLRTEVDLSSQDSLNVPVSAFDVSTMNIGMPTGSGYDIPGLPTEMHPDQETLSDGDADEGMLIDATTSPQQGSQQLWGDMVPTKYDALEPEMLWQSHIGQGHSSDGVHIGGSSISEFSTTSQHTDTTIAKRQSTTSDNTPHIATPDLDYQQNAPTPPPRSPEPERQTKASSPPPPPPPRP